MGEVRLVAGAAAWARARLHSPRAERTGQGAPTALPAIRPDELCASSLTAVFPSLEAPSGHAVPTQRVLSVRRVLNDCFACRASCASFLFFRSLRETPRLVCRQAGDGIHWPLDTLHDPQGPADARAHSHPHQPPSATPD